MAAMDPNYKVFLDWEIKARDVVAKHFPKRTLVKEAQAQWWHKMRQREYAAAVQALESSLNDAKKRDKEIYKLPKRFGRRGLTRLEALRRRWRSLIIARKACRAVRRNIRDLENEQWELDTGDRVIASRRSRDFTAQLVDEAQRRATALELDIDECRTAREDLGSTVPEGSEDSDTDSEEDSSEHEEEEDSSEDEDEENFNENEGEEGLIDEKEEADIDGAGDEYELGDEENEVMGDDKATAGEQETKDDGSTRVGAKDAAGLDTDRSLDKPFKGDEGGTGPTAPTDPRLKPGSGAGRLDMEDLTQLDPETLSEGDVNGIAPSRERKSSQKDGAAGGAKRRQTSDVRDEPPRKPDRASTARASEQEQTIIPPGEEETLSVPPSRRLSKSDGRTMKLKDLLDRWDKLNDLAYEAGEPSGKWRGDFIHWRAAAKRILESEGWAIVPELTEDADAARVLEEIGKKVADAVKEMDIKVKRREFLREDRLKSTRDIGFGGPRGTNPIAGEYVFQKILGKGSYGHASLWVRYDEVGNIVERVAVKDELVKENSWNKPSTFFGDVQDRQPREAVMHRLISNQDPNALHTVRFLASALFMEEKLVRIYMEFCEHGEFYEVWVKNCETREEGDWFLSAPALWALFESLAKAAHLMTFGCFPGEEEPAGWEAIIHRDIKQDNVFMSEPDKTRWRGIPRMKLADFGMAATESEAIMQTEIAGAIGSIPPEMRNPNERPPGLRVSSPADIWTMGMVMIEIMNHAVAAKDFTLDMDESRLPRIKEAGQRYYPKALVDLIHSCVQRLPEQRIGAKELCDRIEEEVKDLRQAELSEEDKSRFPFESEVVDKMAK